MILVAQTKPALPAPRKNKPGILEADSAEVTCSNHKGRNCKDIEEEMQSEGSQRTQTADQCEPTRSKRWCGRRDSNSHTLRRQNLNLVCLPISPRPRGYRANENARLLAWRFGIWGGRWESNPRHQEPQSCALPTELRPPYYLLVPGATYGAPGRTRTCDHPLRRRMLYPTELQAHDR
jgi:hypothetical protein